MDESQAPRSTIIPIFCGDGPDNHVFLENSTVCECHKTIRLEDFHKVEQDQYFYELRKRLKIGAECYGDKSFDKTEGRLLNEVQEEILDIAGWSYILWAKIERLKSKL